MSGEIRLLTAGRAAIVGLAVAGVALGGLILWRTWWSAVSWLGVILITFSPMVAARLILRFFPTAGVRPAMRRYNTRLVVTMSLYVVLLMTTTELAKRGWTAGPLGYVLAVLPALPLVAVFGLYARYFREETDEFQRQVLMTSLVWSGVLTLCEATIWGFLETFDKVPHVWMWAVPVAFFAQLGVTGPLAARRYR